jgi:hypothetical protein
MKKMNLLYLIVFLLVLLFASCRKGKESVKETFSGQVIDQVTKLPVQNAKVYIGAELPCDDFNRSLRSLPNYAITDNEGKFTYIIKISDWPTRDFNCPFIYAQKDSYVGSDVFSIDSVNVVLTQPIQMYHYATVKVRVFNDTISNKVDNEIFGFIIGDAPRFIQCYPGFFYNGYTYALFPKPIFQVNCSGRKFDSTFVFDKCWGNLRYGAGFWQNYPNIYEKGVLAKPDSTVSITISF